MMRNTIAAFAAIVALAGLAPVANANCNWVGCDHSITTTTNVDVNVTLPDNFAAATANGSFTAGANDTTATATGTSSASAVGANGGLGVAGNTTSSGATADNGATAGGSSVSSASAGPAP